jgi:hypothetical protein
MGRQVEKRPSQMNFPLTLLAGWGLIILLVYIFFVYVWLADGNDGERTDPLAPPPWWRNNVLTRRDWLVGVPLVICLAAMAWQESTAIAHEAASQPLWMIALYACSAVANGLILVLCGFYRPVAVVITTFSALTNGANEWQSDYALTDLVFILLAWALWIRALHSIRRRYTVRKLAGVRRSDGT